MLVTGYQKPVHLAANKQIEESCGMKYVKNSIYTSCVLIIRRKVYQAACGVPAKSFAQRAMALCSLWTTDAKCKV